MGNHGAIAAVVCKGVLDSNRLVLGLLASAGASFLDIEPGDWRLVFWNVGAFRLRKPARNLRMVVTKIIHIGGLSVAPRDFAGDRFNGRTRDLLEQYANASPVHSDRCRRCRIDDSVAVRESLLVRPNDIRQSEKCYQRTHG